MVGHAELMLQQLEIKPPGLPSCVRWGRIICIGTTSQVRSLAMQSRTRVSGVYYGLRLGIRICRRHREVVNRGKTKERVSIFSLGCFKRIQEFNPLDQSDPAVATRKKVPVFQQHRKSRRCPYYCSIDHGFIFCNIESAISCDIKTPIQPSISD